MAASAWPRVSFNDLSDEELDDHRLARVVVGNGRRICGNDLFNGLAKRSGIANAAQAALADDVGNGAAAAQVLGVNLLRVLA